MRIAHVCSQCGFDLTRTPAPLDALYGQPIVICPSCGFAVVRREHPTMVWSRWVRRALWTVCLLAGRIATTLAIAGVVVGMTEVAWHLLRELRISVADWPRESLVVGGIVWVVASLVGGLWVGMMWSHWRWWQAAAWWLVLLMGLPLVFGAFVFGEGIMDWNNRGHILQYSWSRVHRSMPSGYWLLVAAWAISLVSMIPGRYFGKISVRTRRRWAWRRARAKRKQAWTSTLLLRA